MRAREETREDKILRPIGTPGPRYFILLAVAGVLLLWFVAAWAWQLKYGLIVTGMADWGSSGSSSWGLSSTSTTAG